MGADPFCYGFKRGPWDFQIGARDPFSNRHLHLRERIEQFNRGWKKASAVIRKSLMKDLLFAVVVTPKGLHIEYRLSEALNSCGDNTAQPASHDGPHNVIDIAARRRDTASGTVPDSAFADAGKSDFGHKKTNLAVGFGNPTDPRNSPIGKLQVVEFGRGRGTRTPDPPVMSRLL